MSVKIKISGVDGQDAARQLTDFVYGIAGRSVKIDNGVAYLGQGSDYAKPNVVKAEAVETAKPDLPLEAGDPVDTKPVAAPAEKPEPEKKGRAKKEKEPEKEKPPVAEAAPLKEEEKAKDEGKPVDIPAEKVGTEMPMTTDTCKTLIRRVSEKVGLDDAQAIIKKYKVDRPSELKDDEIPGWIADCNKALEKVA